MATLFHDAISRMTWSFSRLNSYDQCPKMFYLCYLDREAEQMDSAFSQWGTLCHGLLEDYAKGSLLACELEEEYDRRYPACMTERFPALGRTDLDASYYDNGREFFALFDGFPDNWEIIASERDIRYELDGVKFRGFIDLIVRDKKDGGLMIVDHKSKGRFKSEEELEHYSYQLYLYAIWVHREYGEWPKELIFNMFRAREEKHIPFCRETLDRAIAWMKETIARADADEDFADKVRLRYEALGIPVPEDDRPDFFCSQLCSVRTHCPRSGWCGF